MHSDWRGVRQDHGKKQKAFLNSKKNQYLSERPNVFAPLIALETINANFVIK